MNINIAILMFFFFLLAYLFICEIFTILFRLTGLTETTARFQVISMLTNCGYTTLESELIVKSRKRKKLAFLTILFGYIFSITIVSMIVNLFLSIENENISHTLYKIAFAILINILIWFSLFRINFIKTLFNKFICVFCIKSFFRKKYNPILILGLFQNEVVAEVLVSQLPEELKGTCLKDNKIGKKYSINILAIIKPNNEKIKVKGDTIIEENDTIIIFGPQTNIKNLFMIKIDD
ncbi:TrkA C-terminal domain-containing protein [uncultured Cetobacterium sp.]|uniref:TrkA C-terminal domain-containing protein n=1 Tax=uncultured Cetobacterium sp. TaxID=527638 RepID=UPI00261B8F50|nr:TrkA C-terminal domain-containing protein [uncultured Cetobacterium sp.]